jgi:hypothetical protein
MSYVPYRDHKTRENLVDAMNEAIWSAQREVVEVIPGGDRKVAALAAKVREAILDADDNWRGKLAQAEAELVKAETDMNMAQIEVDQATSTLGNTLRNLDVATGRDVTKYRKLAMEQTKILNTCENMLMKKKNIVNKKTNMAAYQASEIYIVAIPQLGRAITDLDKALANEGAISDLDGVEDRTMVLPVWDSARAAGSAAWEVRAAANYAAIFTNQKFGEYKEVIKEVIRREELATKLEKIAAEKAASSSVMPAERSETMDQSTEGVEEYAAPMQTWRQKPRRRGADAEATANRSSSTIPDSLASRIAATRRQKHALRQGGITKRKKYRRYNKRKTKHYKKKAKRYTKKRNMRY